MTKTELEDYVNRGLSQRAIAAESGKSQGSIKYWLKKHSLETKNQPGRKRAGPDDPRYIERRCDRHGLSRHVKAGTRYRCVKCRSFWLSERRRKIKRDLVELLGGKCRACGYNKSVYALHFHHKDPKTKLLSVSELVQSTKLKEAREEALKCELLCANCHAEEEERLWKAANYYD